MVVEVAVGNSNPVRSLGDVKEAVVVVLASVEVAGQIAVVDPDVGGALQADSITVRSWDLRDLQIAHNNILRFP